MDYKIVNGCTICSCEPGTRLRINAWVTIIGSSVTTGLILFHKPWSEKQPLYAAVLFMTLLYMIMEVLNGCLVLRFVATQSAKGCKVLIYFGFIRLTMCILTIVTFCIHHGVEAKPGYVNYIIAAVVVGAIIFILLVRYIISLRRFKQGLEEGDAIQS